MRLPWRRGLPTLTARVVKALLVAYVLAFVVLLFYNVLQFHEARVTKKVILDTVRAVLAQLPADEASAAAQVATITGVFNTTRRDAAPAWVDLGPLQVELRSAADGHLVFASPLLHSEPVPDQAAPTGNVVLAGRLHGVGQASQGPWRVRIFEPEIATGNLLLFMSEDLAVSMLLTFPVVLFPLWLAVRRGLAPLRELAQWVQRRPAGDFSPMQLNLRYAELQPLEQSFNQLLAHSRAAVERERGFVQDAAHELRTPLAVIAMQAHALAASEPGPARQQALQQMERAIARASHQVHQLLTLARVESPAARRCVDVDCAELARQILIDAEPGAKARNVDLVLDAPEQLLLPLDLVAFHSALENLVGNALKHAHGATRVHVSLRVQAARLLLAVADDGQGVPPQERTQLFDRFHRGRTADTPGTGLGLAIVRESARLLGGEVRCRDGLDGRGLCFEMDLRVAEGR